MYPAYQFLRPAVIFTTVLTTVQSLGWIAMTVTGIVAYYCNIDISPELNAGGLLGQTFFRLYFQGECLPPNFPKDIFGVLDEVSTLTPLDVHAWNWVYLCISFTWFVSGLLMVVYVNKQNMKYANIYLYFWIINTVTVLVLDIVIGSFFARDYSNISEKANTIILSESVERIAVILSAKTSAWIMMAISFRGFILWLLNAACLVYLFKHTFYIHDHNKVKSGFVNNAFVDKNRPRSIDNDPFTPKPWYSGSERGNTGSTAEIPRPKRAGSVPRDPSLNNRTVGSLNLYTVDNSKDYPVNPVNTNPGLVNPNRYSSQDPRQQVSTNYLRPNVNRGVSRDNDRRSNYPRPDYSPSMPRALKVHNSMIDDDRHSSRSEHSAYSGLRRY